MNLSDNCFGVEGAIEIATACGSEKLEEVDLTNTQLCGVNWKREGHYLKKGVVAIALAVVDGGVSTLSLGRNCLGEPGAIAISLAISRSKRLTNLDLHGNNNLGHEGGMAIVESVLQSQSLSVLSLNSTHIGPRAKEKLLEAVEALPGFELTL